MNKQQLFINTGLRPTRASSTAGACLAVLPEHRGQQPDLIRRRSCQLFLSLAGIIVGLILFSTPAQAASIGADGTTCTLVDAITAANTDAVAGGCPAGSGADTITITNTVTLTTANNSDNGLPVISTEITIEGNGHTIARDTTSGNYFRIFAINSTGNLTLNNISITGGLVGGNGGGFHISAGGVLQVNNSTISGNGAMISGGIENGGTITMTNSTMSGNYTTAYGAGAIGNGGTVALFNTTVTGNSAGNLGGGFDNGGTIILNRSIVAGNYAGTGADIFNRNIVIADNYNLLGSGFSVPITSTDIAQSVDIADILNPVLGYNGGPARTHALVAGSPAIDAANDSGLATDQRGIGRPLGTADDIGAYESPSLSTLVVFTGTLSPSFAPDTIAYTMVVTNAISSTSLTSTVNALYATSVVTVTPPSGTPISCTGNPVECPLAVGENALKIFVKSLDGTNAKIYTITITRLSNDATLSNLSVSVGSLSPVFTPTLTTYTLTVEGVTSTFLEATPNEGHATAVVTVTLPSGTPVTCTGDPFECPLELGDNVIEVTVTAQDGTIQVYTIIITRNPSSDATLDDLTLGGNSYDPEFDSGITSYTATVSNLITSTIISPTVNDLDATAVVTVTPPGGTPIACTGSPLDCPLAVGANVIEVVVTAQNGTTQTYTVTVIREPSDDATLGDLGIGVGTLTPAFDPGTDIYTATVGNETTSLTLTVATNEPNATITTTVTPPGGTPITCTGDPLDCPLAVGDNVIEVMVTAQDGTTVETYTIIVTRAPSSDATLSELSLSNGTLSPAFTSGNTSYTATVANSITNTLVSVLVTEPNATVVITVTPPSDGNAIACTGDPADCPLAVGNNLIEVLVTAQDGTTLATYGVLVTRLSNDATLDELSIGVGTLSPVFAPGTTSYTATVGNETTSVTLTVAANEGNATTIVTVTPPGGTPITCTGDPLDCPLAVGDNVIEVTVTAQDGTIETYTIIVTREPSSDATLGELDLGTGTLSPVFAPGTTSYTATVGNETTSVTLTVAANEGNATTSTTVTPPGGVPITCTGDPVDCPLSVGDNVIEVTVTAQDGTTIETYTIIVTREPSSDASLGELEIGTGTLTPAFAPGTTSYTATVGNATTSITLTTSPGEGNAIITTTVTPPGGTPITCTGDPVDCPLAVGENVIEVTVTAQDGTIETYTIIVTREPSSDATLGELDLGTGTLSPAFAPNTTSYTATVANATSSLTLTVASNEPNATISTTVTPPGGTPITCTGDPLDCPLAIGDNEIIVTVTAQDGTTIETYTIIVTRVSNDATLGELSIGTGSLTPAFAPNTTSYTATVGNATTSLTLTVDTNEGNATTLITVTPPGGGTPIVCTGDPLDCPLAVGENVVEITITAQDGTTKTYTTTVTREPSTDATVGELDLGIGSLTPAFDPNVTSYTATVGNATNNITLTVDTTEGNATTIVTVTPPGGQPITCTGNPLDCPLAVGDNVIEVTVTAQDGTTTKTYTTTVTRAPSSDATLSAFSIDGGILSPAFSSEVTDYIATVSNVVNSLGITLTANESNALPVITVTPPGGGAPITCTGNPLICPLAIGDNLIEITVTAQDGTTKIYHATITRPSDDATLIELAIDGVTLSPLFNSQITSYVATVGNATTNVNVTLAPNEGNATTAVTVTPPGGTPVACPGDPAACPLAVGDNAVAVTVTAQDGSTTTYTTIVTRQASSNATLGGLTLSSGTLSPAFTPNNTAYVANVASGVTTFSVTPITGDDAATVTVNGVSVATGTASTPLTLPTGSHLTVNVVVTAGDGTTSTYPIVVNRPPSAINSATSTLQDNPITLQLTTEVTDPDGDAWAVQTVANGQHGTAVLNANGSFTYTPSPAFVGVDQFGVTVVDDYGATAQLLANVVVVAKDKSGQAGDVLVQNNTTGSTHQLTNYQVNDKTLFTMNLQLSAGAYSGPLSSEDIFYLLYTEILTPTTEVATPPSGFQFAGNTFTLEAFLNELKLPNLVFGQPVTLTLSYDEALLDNIDEATLTLYYWDEESMSWEQSGLTEISRDLTANTVTYRIAHLTQFSWFGEAKAPVEQQFKLWFPFVPYNR